MILPGGGAKFELLNNNCGIVDKQSEREREEFDCSDQQLGSSPVTPV